MSESNRTILRYVPEVTYGVTPVDDAGWKPIPFNSESLNVGPETTQSQRIRGTDRMPADMKKVNTNVGGQVGIEFSFADFDDFLEAAMGGTYSTDTLTAASVSHSFTIEKEFSDLTNHFIQLKGCRVGQLDLSFGINELVTGSITFAGADGLEAAASLVGSGSESAATGNDVFAGNVDTDSVTYDGTLISTSGIIITRIDLSINNTLRPNYSLDSVTPVDQKTGTHRFTGTIEAYVADESWEIYEDMLANTEVALAWTFTDDASKGYTISLPKIKLSGEAPGAAGIDQDNMIRAEFLAIETPPVITRIP